MNVYVAYSGGTDSTYSILHYKERGDNVVAVHAQFAPKKNGTEANIALLEAFCVKHDIAFVYLDLQEVFQETVIEAFCSMYTEGKTPNPCALCNPQMKFGLLRSYAFAHGADIFATGHYTQCRLEGGRHVLYPALDTTKDQSYFLSLVPESSFASVEFPLGNKIKESVREELVARGVTPPFPSDSQEICFIPNDDYRLFLQERVPNLAGSGDIQLRTGEVVGKHTGLWQYTEGQRKGLAVAWQYPLYVLEKDIQNNILYVGAKEEAFILSCIANNANIFIPVEEWGEKLFVRTRYRQKAVEADVTIHEGTLTVNYKEPQEPVACGQVLAVYSTSGAIVAGGILVG